MSGCISYIGRVQRRCTNLGLRSSDLHLRGVPGTRKPDSVQRTVEQTSVSRRAVGRKLRAGAGAGWRTILPRPEKNGANGVISMMCACPRGKNGTGVSIC